MMVHGFMLTSIARRAIWATQRIGMVGRASLFAENPGSGTAQYREGIVGVESLFWDKRERLVLHSLRFAVLALELLPSHRNPLNAFVR
jgi:hypothetical protein